MTETNPAIAALKKALDDRQKIRDAIRQKYGHGYMQKVSMGLKS